MIVVKDKLNKVLTVIIIILIIIIGVIIVFKYFVKKEENYNPAKIIDFAYEIETEKGSCGKNKSYYKLEDGRTIYTNCLKEININDFKEVRSLKDTLKDDENIIERIINALNEHGEVQEYFKAKIYIDEGELGFSNEGLKILVCDSSKNKNIYIGSLEADFNKDMCE